MATFNLGGLGATSNEHGKKLQSALDAATAYMEETLSHHVFTAKRRHFALMTFEAITIARVHLKYAPVGMYEVERVALDDDELRAKLYEYEMQLQDILVKQAR